MDHSAGAGVLGIGVITHNRRQALEQCVSGILRHTITPYRLVIADDGSDDGTAAWARSLGLLVITGPRRGVVWNKNRALHYFLCDTDCDPIALIEDDHWPARNGWDEVWRDAVAKWHHVNLDRSTYTWNARWWASGEGTPERPFFTNRVWGTGFTTREALERVGYLDSRFVGYGGGHGEWLRRFRAIHADEWNRRCPVLDHGFLVTGALASARNRAEMERNMALAHELARDSGEPIFRMAWRTEEERIRLEREIHDGVEAYLASQECVPAVEPTAELGFFPPRIAEEIATIACQPEGPLDLDKIAHLLSPLAAEAARRIAIPNGPPVAVYCDGNSPVRAAIAIYSLILNGYGPEKVALFGEHRWSEETKAFLQASLSFAEFPATESLRSAVRRAGGETLEGMIGGNDFGLRAAMALFVSNEEMCILEDDVVVLDGLDEGVNRLRTHDLVFAPAIDKGRQFRKRWPTARKLPRPLATADFGGGLYWLRPVTHPGLIAQQILRLSMPSGGNPDRDWLNGLIALAYARHDIWKLPEQLHINTASALEATPKQLVQLRQTILSYDFQRNPSRLGSVCLAPPLQPLSDGEALAVAPFLFVRSGSRRTELTTHHQTLQSEKSRFREKGFRVKSDLSNDGLTTAKGESQPPESRPDGINAEGVYSQINQSPIVATPESTTALRVPAASRMSASEGNQRTKAVAVEDPEVECPCCGWHGDRFLGFSGRMDARCPSCRSLERHRSLALYLKQETPLFSGQPIRLLHFAPEPSVVRLFRDQSNIDYVTTDLSMRHVSIRMDFTDLLFKNGVFDWVICSHVLEHIPDDRQALRELRRVMKPSGVAIIILPVDLDLATTKEDPEITTRMERARAFGQADHVRVCGRDYGNRIASEGFTVTERHYYEELPENEVRRYGLFRKDPMFKDVIYAARPEQLASEGSVDRSYERAALANVSNIARSTEGKPPVPSRDGTQLREVLPQIKPSPMAGTPESTVALRVPSAPRLSVGELALFDTVIADKKSVIEFGMGGSTIRLLQKSAAMVISVESDPRWSKAITNTDLVSQCLARGRLVVHCVDVGEVGSFGFPKDRSVADRWEEYWIAPWRDAGSDEVDLVFIDGRFRVACTLNSLLQGSPTLTIMIHDFWNRPHYQVLLKHLETVKRTDTLGVFVPRERLDRAQITEELAKYARDPR
jgi:SAM-dependent methyltransferase